MFEGTHENPELIWNEEGRSQVQRVVKELKSELFAINGNIAKLNIILLFIYTSTIQTCKNETIF